MTKALQDNLQSAMPNGYRTVGGGAYRVDSYEMGIREMPNVLRFWRVLWKDSRTDGSSSTGKYFFVTAVG